MLPRLFASKFKVFVDAKPFPKGAGRIHNLVRPGFCLAYSDEARIVVEVVVGIEAIVIVVAYMKHAPVCSPFAFYITAASQSMAEVLRLYFMAALTALANGRVAQACYARTKRETAHSG